MNPGGRPELSFWQIWNMCFGFLGIQFGFALQNANVSRIFQTLGASIDEIPLLWIAAPLTGLLVQPVIGYFSDRTWTRLGRRRPYFLVGALLASLALVAMPLSPTLWVAAGLLWMLDASINVSMEPLRAFLGDQLSPRQRPTGFAMQGFFIGVGAVVAGLLPWLLAQAGVSNAAQDAGGAAMVPDTVRYAFHIGAAVMFLAVGWTVWRSREYPPEDLHAFSDNAPAMAIEAAPRQWRRGLVWLAAGLAAAALVTRLSLDRELLLVCAGAVIWGVLLLVFGGGRGPIGDMLRDFDGMPVTMRRLAAVQFFSWIALFAMWIYTTPAVAATHFHSTDPASAAYNEGANWVGVLFAVYNGFAALAALAIPHLVRRIGLKATHIMNLVIGAIALASIPLIDGPRWLLLPMLGIGFVWASILSIPYALLSDSLPAGKMGLYMGFFNFFIVIPQLFAATVLGVVLRVFFAGSPAGAMLVGGLCFLVAALLVLRVPHRAA